MLRHSERRGKGAVQGEPKRHRYQVYGLTVESELELPELVPALHQKPDVHIRFGNVPETLDNLIGHWSWCMASNSEFAFTIEGVARYHVAEGRTITIERRLDLREPAPAADIRLWLLGSAFGALLHQRGLLPLHVSAVKAESGVWAFTGESGEGKSTLAGFLHRHYSWELVSDDVSVMDTEGAQPLIYPGPRKLKLWVDALNYLGFEGCSSVRDLSNTDKFQLYLPSKISYEPECLNGLILLESMAEDRPGSIEELRGMEAFNACLSSIYRPYMDSWFKVPQKRLDEIVTLCRSIKIYRFRRPRSLEGFEKNLGPLLGLIMDKKN